MLGATAKSQGGHDPSVVSGATAALAGQVAVYVLGFAVSVLIARALGPAGRGEYFLPVTAAAVCLAVVHLDIELANTVMLAERRFTLTELTQTSGVLAAIIGPLAAGALFGVYELTRTTVFEGVSPGDFAIAAAAIPIGLHQLWLTGVFVLAKRIGRTQVALVAGAVLQLLGAAVLFWMEELGVTEVLLLYAGSIALPWLVLLAWSSDVARVWPAVNTLVIRKVLAFGLRWHIGALLLFLLLRFDVFLVGAYLGSADVGLYSIAILLAELAWLLTNPLVQAVIPFQAERSARESAPLAFKAARFNFSLAGLLCVLFAATLWFALPAIYGEEFRAAYPALIVLLPGVWLMAGARPLLILVSRQERPILYASFASVALALNLGLGVMLIPSIGLIGASLASTVAYAFLAVAITLWALSAGGLPANRALSFQPDDGRTVRNLVMRLRKSPRYPP